MANILNKVLLTFSTTKEGEVNKTVVFEASQLENASPFDIIWNRANRRLHLTMTHSTASNDAKTDDVVSTLLRTNEELHVEVTLDLTDVVSGIETVQGNFMLHNAGSAIIVNNDVITKTVSYSGELLQNSGRVFSDFVPNTNISRYPTEYGNVAV